MQIQNSVNIMGHTQKTIAAGGQSDPLGPGTYDVWAAADTYIAVSRGSVQNLTTATGYLITAGNVVSVEITEVGCCIGSTSELKYHRTR